jgi:Glycosyltransferase
VTPRQQTAPASSALRGTTPGPTPEAVTKKMNTLLLIPSVLKSGVEACVSQDRHPTMDYYALAEGLREASPTGRVDLLDYGAVERETHPLVKLARRVGGKDAALAMMGFLRRKDYDTIFTNGENVALPLALLLRPLGRNRPGHVTIGHRLSTGKKRLFFKTLGLHREMDTIFVYATTQHTFGREQLAIPAEKLRRIAFHADHRFWRPLPAAHVEENLISSAGLEWRDYPTLIEAVREMPELTVRLAAASPWSKHTNETANRKLPENVEARRYDYGTLRRLYSGSSVVVVPLYENDFQAGVTTLLEAMSMGKAVIVTQTTGQTDVVTDGENGITVAPGDVEGWRAALRRLLGDEALRQRLGDNARAWVETHATLDHWVQNVVSALQASAAPAAARRGADQGAPVQADARS